MKGRAIPYEPEELAWIEARKDWIRADLHRAFCNFWRRDDVSFGAFIGLCKRRGWLTGRTGRIEAGAVPHNKGKPMSAETRAKCLRTAFRKGQLPHNHRGAGHERIDNKDGYVVLIVDEVNPWSGAATRPVHKHRYLWEQVNGEIPDGMALKCLDGNKLNTDPSNWELIPRALLPRLNGRWNMKYDTAPDELKPTLMALAKVKHKAREVRK